MVKLSTLIIVTAATFFWINSEAAESGGDDGIPKLKITVDGYKVTGFNPLSERATEKIVNEFTGTFSDLEAIRAAADALERAIHAKGYTLQEVAVPPQPLSNRVITLEVVGFVVADILVEGNTHFSSENVRRSVPGLAVGQPPNSKAIDLSLQVANKNPRKRTNLKFLSPSSETQELNTTLSVSDQTPYQFFAWANNTGTENTGEFRLGVGFQYANVFDRDHVATATYTTSPDEQEKVDQFGASYKIPFYRIGGMLDLLYAKSDIDSGRVAGGFDISGAGEVFGAAFTKYFQKRESYSQTVVLGVSDKLFDNNVEFGGTRFDTDVRSRPLSLRYLGRFVDSKWIFDFFMGAFVNLPGGEFNDDLSYTLARIGSDSDWVVARYGVSAARPIGNWSFSIGLVGQYADEPLIPGEQFGLGGLYSVRGFREREITSDRANWLTLQLLAPEKKGFTPLVFVDVAEGTRIDPLPSEVARESLSSIGVGTRWRSTRSRASFVFYLGYVLNGTDPAGVGTTRDGDYRGHFNFVVRN